MPAQLSLIEPRHDNALPERVARTVDALKNSEYFREGVSRDNHRYFEKLVCPYCNSPEAYVRKDRPWLLICNRRNNCGAVIKTRDLVRVEPFNEFSFPSTYEDPHAPATNYLKVERALDTSLKGLKYTYERNVRNTGSGAVMFYVGVNKEGQDVHNGRLFNPPPGVDKTHNTPGSTSRGMVWSHPGIEYDIEKDTYVTEGIINALALIEMGFQAIAILASNQFPENVDLSPWPRRVFAFDNDDAGQKATRKWRKHEGKDSRAILPPKGMDWNDILIGSTAVDAGKYIAENLPKFEFYANLATVDRPDDYVRVYHGFTEKNPGLFRMGRNYYYGTMKQTRDGEEPVATRVSNFIVRVRYFELNDSDPEEPDNRYALKILPETGRPTDCIVTAADLSAAHQMTKMFLQRARVLWKGEKPPTMSLIEKIVSAKAPVVRQVQSIGYDTVSGWYVHPMFAIDKDGRMHHPKQGFFETKPNNLIRPTRDPDISMILPKKGDLPPVEIYHKINRAWPNKGPVAIAWTMAAWWVNQIKDTIGFFPHMSFHKDSQTGKSNLSILLHKIQCMDTEGIPLNKSTTIKGLTRKIGQKSGCIVGLLESNSHDRASLNYADLVLTTYNKNPLQTRAKTTNDLQTHDIPNRAAMLFVQNNEPFSSKQERERVISLAFRDKDKNEETYVALQDLKKIQPSDFASIYATVMQSRKKVESNWQDEFEKAKIDLAGIKDSRIIENHALVLAFHRLLCDIIGVKGMDDSIRTYLLNIGESKRIECAQNIGEEADMFFDVLSQLDDNHKDVISVLKFEGEYVVINLPGVLRVIHQFGFQPFDKRRLQEELRAHPAYVPEESNKSYRFWEGSEKKVKKGWCFDLTKCKAEGGNHQ